MRFTEEEEAESVLEIMSNNTPVFVTVFAGLIVFAFTFELILTSIEHLVHGTK